MRHWLLIGWIAASGLTTAAASGQSPDNGPPTGIVMQVEALKTNDGLVFCDLHNSEKTFPNKPARALARVKVRPVDGKASCVFQNVAAGRYAVAVWHDTNSNQKLDTNFVGIPKEPVGSSNNAKGQFGPPKFKDAAFDYRPPSVRQTIKIE